MKLKSLITILISGLVIFGCGNKDKKNNGAPGPGIVIGQGDQVAKFKYYNGGFDVPDSEPDWLNDMTITFTTTGFYVEGKHEDSLCTRGDSFTEAQADQLFALASALQVTQFTNPASSVQDAGVEFIEITNTNGAVHRYYLRDSELSSGDLLAINPEQIRDFLQDLEEGLPTACQ